MHIIAAVRNRIDRFLRFFENPEIPFHRHLITFAAVILLRQVLEMFSTGHTMSAAEIVHYFLWYAGTAACLIWILQLAIRGEPARVARVVTSGYVLVLLAPILDLLISPGVPSPMKYLQGSWPELLRHYGTFCFRCGARGFSIGMKIEIAVVFVLALIYLAVKIRRPLRIILSLFRMYTALFAFGLVGKIVYDLYDLLFRSVGAVVVTIDDRAMGAFLFLPAAVFVILALRKASPAIFRALGRDLRPLAILHYVAVFVIGYLLWRNVMDRSTLPGGTAAAFVRLDHRIFGFLLVPVSLVGGAIFSIVTNNLSDTAADRASHPERPHVAGSVPLATYRAVGWWSLSASLAAAALAGGLSLLFLGVMVGGYALYSMPPLRLKRVPVVGKLLIGTNSVAAALAGFTLFGGEVGAFPPLYIAFFCGPFALAANALDLGDVEGDRSAGIRTLAVILGPTRARWAAALFTVGAYVMMGLMLGDLRLVGPLLLLASSHTYAVLRRPFRPAAVLLVNAAAMTALAVVLGFRAAG